jgi:hypothetical protein
MAHKNSNKITQKKMKWGSFIRKSISHGIQMCKAKIAMGFLMTRDNNAKFTKHLDDLLEKLEDSFHADNGPFGIMNKLNTEIEAMENRLKSAWFQGGDVRNKEALEKEYNNFINTIKAYEIVIKAKGSSVKKQIAPLAMETQKSLSNIQKEIKQKKMALGELTNNDLIDHTDLTNSLREIVRGERVRLEQIPNPLKEHQPLFDQVKENLENAPKALAAIDNSWSKKHETEIKHNFNELVSPYVGMLGDDGIIAAAAV